MTLSEPDLKHFQTQMSHAEQQNNSFAFLEQYLDEEAVITVRLKPDGKTRTWTTPKYLRLVKLGESHHDEDEEEETIDEVISVSIDQFLQQGIVYSKNIYKSVLNEDRALKVTSNNFIKCKVVDGQLRIIEIQEMTEEITEISPSEVNCGNKKVR